MSKVKSSKEKEVKDYSDIKPGDLIEVYYRVVEGNRERIQPYQGTVISVRGSGNGRTITVRRVSYGIGVERTFPLKSPQINRIDVKRKGKVRRAKLYYLRDRVGKGTRIKEKREEPGKETTT